MFLIAGKGALVPFLVAATVVTLACTAEAAGLDAPHNASNNVGCLSCHQMTSTYPKLLPPQGHSPQHIDDTLANNLCWSCHNDFDFPNVLTHSSRTTSNKYGDWSVECWVCHNQHIQEQNRANGSTYGKYIRRTIDLSKITGLVKTGKKTVTFLGNTGANSFADSNGSGSGVCQVCHTSTGHWSASAPTGDKHFSAWACTECHDHGTSFKPGWPDHDTAVTKPPFCASCHATSVFSLHQADETTYTNCNRCHQVNNNYEFAGTLPGVYLKGRLARHSGKDKQVFTSTARCDDCHHGQFAEHVTNTGHNRLHDKVILGYDSDDDGTGDQVLACDACHFPDLIQEHVTRRNYTCSVCHDRSGLGLVEVAAISNAIAAGMAGTQVFCDDCHNDDHFLTEPGTSLIKEHHHTSYSKAGDCSKCHVVGPGERGPQRPPCWYCHGAGKPGDPQRAGVNSHDQGPAISETGVKDFRACFSCHLDGGQGYVAGTTPLLTPMHGLPNTDSSKVYWPYGYYRDASNQWVASDPLIPSAANNIIPSNLENDPARWSTWPGWHTLNYLGVIKKVNSSTYNDYTHPEVQDWARFGGGGTYNPIRWAVNIDYRRQDYPTVSIRNGGVFEIPSFDGTGSIGKSTGSGSVRVTLNPEAVTGGAQWRLDGGPWQDSGDSLAAVTDRANHLVEFKPLAEMDEPPPVGVTVTNGQTTEVDGPTATYTTCPENPQLTMERTGGDKNPTFSWTSPEQGESFRVIGWRSGPVACELWQKNGAEMVEAPGFAVTTSPGGDTCQLAKNGATPAGDYDLVLRATGSSCFRNFVDLPLFVNVTAAGAPSPFGQAGGTIREPFTDSLALSATFAQDFIHLTGNLYVHLNRDGVLSTFTIDSQGNISSVLASADLWGGAVTGTSTNTKMVRVTDTLVAISYSVKIGVDETYETRLMTVSIEANGTVLVKKQEYLFNTARQQWWPRIYPHTVDSSLFIVTWGGYENSYFRGLMTVRISPSGVIEEQARNMGLPGVWSEKGAIVHVAGDNYAYVGNKYIYIFQVSSAGAITILNTPGSQYQFSTDGYYAEMTRVKGNIFAVAYIKNYVIGPGMLKTLAISDSGVISPTINSYLFEPCGAGYADPPNPYALADNVLALFYDEYGGCDAQDGINLKTFEITDDGRIMVPPLDVLELSGGSTTPMLLPVDGDMFAFLLSGDTSQGATFNGVKTYGISTDRDRDGKPSDSDNCSEIANAGQADGDGDGVGDPCDACPGADDRLDADSDTVPDACDICAGHDDASDSDGDTTPDGCDPCPGDPANDADQDGICAGSGFAAPKVGDGDNCPGVANGDQVDSDCDDSGDACGASVYFPPGAVTVIPVTSKWLTLSWNDAMRGEDGYRLEGKQGDCGDTATSFWPMTTVYRHDRFDTGLDTTGWVPGATVKTTSATTFPASVTDATGTAEVSWENGKIRLHSVMNDMGEAGAFNNTFISVNKYAQVIGDKDFDLQVDYELPNGAFFGDQYHVDVRLGFYFPDTDGKHNEALIERRADHYGAYLSINGVAESGVIPTIDESGTLRLVRKNRELSAYILDGDDWLLVKRHSQPQTADLTPTWMGVVQYAQRNESGGGELTALVDNFKFNTVGSVPVAALDLPLDEPSWTGASGEVKDATTGNHHGTAHNGANTALDGTRGTVGSFDGIDDYVEVPGSGSLENVTDRSFTFAGWAKPVSAPPMSDPNPPANDWRYTIIGRPGWHTDLYYNTNKTFRFEIWNTTDNTFTVVSPAYEPGQWHHVAGVADDAAKTIKIYIDGELKGTAGYTGNLRDYGTTSYLIGTSNHDVCCYMWFFDGLIDEARVFDHALSDTEVAALANNRLEYSIRGQVPDTTFCARAYPFKTNDCTNWPNHAAEGQATTLTSTAAQATTAGKATAVSVRGAAALYVNVPYLNDTDADNSYSVEYKLSADTTWTTHAAGAPHTATPFATKISGLTVLEKYDVRVTYIDPDGVNGTTEQVIANVVIEPGQSCLSILNNGGATGDGVYTIDSDGVGPSSSYQAYCDMSSDGGGWTLAMKLDGSQTTFQYSSTYWTTTNTLNPANSGFDTTQAKLQSFNDVPFSQVRLGMRILTDPADDIDWITVNQSAGSLVSLFTSGFIATGVGRANWLNLLEGVNTQDNCNKEGFNAEQSYSRMRIGLAMNAENDCNSCDRILGFGNDPAGHPWGAWAVVGGGYPGVNTQAYGWIMVR